MNKNIEEIKSLTHNEIRYAYTYYIQMRGWYSAVWWDSGMQGCAVEMRKLKKIHK